MDASPLGPVIVQTQRYFKQKELEGALAKECKKIDSSDVYSTNRGAFHFDLSRSEWFDLGTLLWFITLLNALRRAGNEVTVRFADRGDAAFEKVWGFLLRWRFFDVLSDVVGDPLGVLVSSQHEHLSLKPLYSEPRNLEVDGVSLHTHGSRLLEIASFGLPQTREPEENSLAGLLLNYADEVLITALREHCGWNEREARNFATYVIREGVKNSGAHANGSFGLVAMRLDKRKLHLAMSDNGVGIPQVLRSAAERKELTLGTVETGSDADLIRYFATPEFAHDSMLVRLAVRKGVTTSHGSGLGLYYLKRYVLQHGGELRIRSGRALVDFTEQTEDPSDGYFVSPGTTLRVILPLDK